jgi:hypothetical protein
MSDADLDVWVVLVLSGVLLWAWLIGALVQSNGAVR